MLWSSTVLFIKKVIHSSNYVDPVTGVHAQGVERQWVEIRALLRRSRGNRKLLQSHMDEQSWREMHRDKMNTMALFDQIISDIKRVHDVP